MLDSAYACFQNGVAFCHHSDDCFTLINKMAIIFAELVDRNAFMSDMYGLTFKVNKKEYMEPEYMILAKELLNVINKCDLKKFMAVNTDIYQGTRDGKYNGPDQFKTPEGYKRCYGSKPYVETYDYITRCQNWGGIVSFFDDKGQLVRKGLNFLKNYFTLNVFGDTRQLVPRRELGELWAKLMLPKAYYDTPKKRLAQLKSMAFFFVHEQWDEFMSLYDWFVATRLNGSNDITHDDLDRRTLEDYFYMLGGDDSSFNFTEAPTKSQCTDFYRHKGLKTQEVGLKETIKRDSFKRLASKVPIMALIGRTGFHPNATKFKL